MVRGCEDRTVAVARAVGRGGALAGDRSAEFRFACDAADSRVGRTESHRTFCPLGECRLAVKVAPDRRGAEVMSFDLKREFDALTAIGGSGVPHPEPLAFVGRDESPIERDILVLEWVGGATLAGPLPETLNTAYGGLVTTDSIIDVTVALTSLDASRVGYLSEPRAASHIDRQFLLAKKILSACRTPEWND